MNPQEFYDRCAAHDWYYANSDDHAAWRKGRNERLALTERVNEEPYATIWGAWCAFVAGTALRPERPPINLVQNLQERRPFAVEPSPCGEQFTIFPGAPTNGATHHG
jgi:hypothetical protein